MSTKTFEYSLFHNAMVEYACALLVLSSMCQIQFKNKKEKKEGVDISMGIRNLCILENLNNNIILLPQAQHIR